MTVLVRSCWGSYCLKVVFDNCGVPRFRHLILLQGCVLWLITHCGFVLSLSLHAELQHFTMLEVLKLFMLSCVSSLLICLSVFSCLSACRSASISVCLYVSFAVFFFLFLFFSLFMQTFRSGYLLILFL